MADANPSTRLRRAAPTRPRRFLASPAEGAGVDETGAKKKSSRHRVETYLRDELRRLWVAPADCRSPGSTP